MVMDEKELKMFLFSLCRSEFVESPDVYAKAVCVSLIALGFNESWVNNEFRSSLEDYYSFLWE